MPEAGWQDQATCRGLPPEVFFPDPIGNESDEAAERREVEQVRETLCDLCPVRQECLDAARLEQPRSQQVGIRAGMTGGQRRVYYKEQEA